MELAHRRPRPRNHQRAMTDFFADIEHQALVLSRNPIVLNVDSVLLPLNSPRNGLRYRNKLFMQAGFQNSSFTQIAEQEASEQPITGNNSLSTGAYFLLNKRIDDALGTTPPVFGNNEIAICPNLTRQYYTKSARYNNGVLIDEITIPTAWVYRAGISERDYDNYRNLFFTEHVGKKRRFLTWQPNNKIVGTDQPEFLYFLTNFTPTPTRLNVRVRCLYDDGSRELFTALSINTVSYMTVYCVPVGYEALSLASRPKKVVAYSVWISNQNTEQVSEIRNFNVDYAYHETCRYLVFLNGLGTYDTIRCIGNAVERQKVSRQIIERFAGYDYLPTSSNEVINAATGERSLEISMGNWLSVAHANYLEDLLLSSEFYVAENGYFMPLIPSFDALTLKNAAEWPIERSFTFRFANRREQYSDLPKVPKPTRPVAWKPYVTSCEIDGNGIRTGRGIVNELVLYYTDTLNLVKPLVTKSNVPNSEGYTAPQSNSNCAPGTTPFLSAQIQALGSFSKQDCGQNLLGTPATITIVAGRFGSEISQADANNKANLAFISSDTQSNANVFGGCSNILPENYSLSVPNGHYHYRCNDPSKISITNGPITPTRGNAWWVPDSSAPYKFATGSNDIDMLLEDAELTISGLSGANFNLKIYQNGVLKHDQNGSVNNENYAKAWLFNTGAAVWPASNKYAPGSGDKMYIKITWL